MRTVRALYPILPVLLAAAPLQAQELSGEELRLLLANGLTLTLGGPAEGYEGSVRLKSDGTGVGSVVTDRGKHLDISGTWAIEGEKFCRQWKFDQYKKTCETWNKIAENKVEVLVDGRKIGVNSW